MIKEIRRIFSLLLVVQIAISNHWFSTFFEEGLLEEAKTIQSLYLQPELSSEEPEFELEHFLFSVHWLIYQSIFSQNKYQNYNYFFSNSFSKLHAIRAPPFLFISSH